MHSDTHGRRPRPAADEPGQAAALSWQEAIETAQHDLAADIAQLIDHDGLHRDAYLRWLAAESALCHTSADALKALAPTLSAPAMGDWVKRRVDVLHDWERMAAADVRRTDGIVDAIPVAVDPWHGFIERHRSTQPYRVLGAIALHEAVAGGVARAAIMAMLERSFLPVRGCTYLLHRLLAADDSNGDWRWLWQQASDDAQRKALCDGAWHGATLYRRIVQAALQGAPRLSPRV